MCWSQDCFLFFLSFFFFFFFWGTLYCVRLLHKLSFKCWFLISLSTLTSTNLPLPHILTLRASVMCSDESNWKGNALCLSDHYYGPWLTHVHKVLYYHFNSKRTNKHKWSHNKFFIKLSLWIWLHSVLVHKKVAGRPREVYGIYRVTFCSLLTCCNLILALCTAVRKVRTIQKCSTILINYKWWICNVWWYKYFHC